MYILAMPSSSLILRLCSSLEEILFNWVSLSSLPSFLSISSYLISLSFLLMLRTFFSKLWMKKSLSLSGKVSKMIFCFSFFLDIFSMGLSIYFNFDITWVCALFCEFPPEGWGLAKFLFYLFIFLSEQPRKSFSAFLFEFF